MRSETRDEIYRDARPRVDDFSYNRDVADVFDDMITRSVPFYAEIQRMVRELAADFAVPGTQIYDLGCSIGTTLLQLDTIVDRHDRAQVHRARRPRSPRCTRRTSSWRVFTAIAEIRCTWGIFSFSSASLSHPIHRRAFCSRCLFSAWPMQRLWPRRRTTCVQGLAYGSTPMRGVPRWIPRLRGLRSTLQACRFHWRRVLAKEYGTPFAWISGLCLIGIWNLWTNGRFHAQRDIAEALAGATLLTTLAWSIVRVLEKRRVLVAD